MSQKDESVAFPRKGSRSISVDGQQYRWKGLFCASDRLGGEHNEVFVQANESPRQVLRASFLYDVLRREYARVGHHVSRRIDHPPPYVVRQVIELGLREGWRPHEAGKLFDLGEITARIDWSGLSPQPSD